MPSFLKNPISSLNVLDLAKFVYDKNVNLNQRIYIEDLSDLTCCIYTYNEDHIMRVLFLVVVDVVLGEVDLEDDVVHVKGVILVI